MTITIALIHSHETTEQLRRCVDSLVDQIKILPQFTFKWILICAPEAHTKDTDFFPGLVIRSTTNNLAANRNRAIEQAQSKWLYFTDPDCWGTSTTLSMLLNQAVAHNDKYYAVAGPNYLLSKNSRLQNFFQFLGEMRWLNGGLTQIARHRASRSDWHAPTCNIIYDLEHVGAETYSPLFSRVGEDLEFHFRLKKKNKKILFHNEAWVWHEQSDSLWKYLKKIFFYGTAQTQLLNRHPHSVKNKRLLALVALFTWAFLLLVLPLSQAWIWLTLSWGALLALLCIEYFKNSSAKYFGYCVCAYVLMLSSYGLGQFFGLLILPLHTQSGRTIQANT